MYHEPRKRGAGVGLICATILAALAFFLVAGEPAHAQFPFWPQSKSWWGNPAPVRHKHHKRQRKPQLAKKTPAPEAPEGPLQIVISIADQRISVYEGEALIARSSVSTGVPDHPTPLGVFSVIGKQRWHRSNLYSAAPMPYMQRLTWSGIALHAGPLPGRPASHGCIRLRKDFAIRLSSLTRRGTRVIIATHDVRPVETVSPQLAALQPKPALGPPESGGDVASGSRPKDAVVAAAAVQPPLPPKAETQAATDVPAPGATRTAAPARKPVPISVFISRKLSRLFVRQGFKPLFESPIRIEDPERALGTHVFTVMTPGNEDAAPRWTVVSMPEKPADTPGAAQRRTPGKHLVEIIPSPDKANAALSRIDIPPDA